MTLHLETEKAAYTEFFYQPSGQTDWSTCDSNTDIQANNINFGMHDFLNTAFPIRQDDDMVTLQYVRYDVRVYSSDGDQFELSEIGSEGLFYRHSNLPAILFYTDRSDLIVTLYQVIWEKDKEDGERIVADIREQDVCFGHLPRMSSNGTFMHDGVEKRYAGAGSAVDGIRALCKEAFIGIRSSIKSNFTTLNTINAFPFDFVERCHLENETTKFLDELVPITLH